MPGLRGVATAAALLLGSLAALGGIGHWIAVTIKAFSEGRGYDVRLGDMLAIGFLPFILGAAMVAGAALAGRDPATGMALAAISSGLLAIVLVVLWRTIFTGPEGSVAGGTLVVVAFMAEAVVAWLAR
jgi:hypothetical protein